MFTVPKESELSAGLIESAIEYNEKERSRYDKLEKYYRGKHDILSRRKPPTAKNTRVVINHANYIVDTSTGYLLGNPIEYKSSDDFDITEIDNQYKMQTMSDLDHEIAKDVSIFGKQYELIYTDENNVKSTDIDVRNCVVVYDDTVEHAKLFAVIYRKSDEKDKDYEDIVVYDEEFEYVGVDTEGSIGVGEQKPHKFGAVPVIEYRNNSEEMGDFEQVISLIDAYNLLQSDRINDKEQLVEAILVGYNVNLEKAQMQELLINRTMFGLPEDSKVEYLIKTLDEGQVDILRKTLEDDIHKIAKVPNMADENFAGNSSGVAIRYKLLAFEQNVKNKERYFEAGLMERFEVYNNYLVAINKMSFVPRYEIDAVFKRNLPQNILEISQIVNNLRGVVDDETLIGQIPFVDDVAQSIKKAREESSGRYQLESTGFGTDNSISKEVDKEVGASKKTIMEKLSDLIG